MITYNDVKNDEKIKAYIRKADESLLALGFTEHSFAHVGLVSERAGYLLEALGYSEKDIDLVKIAGHLHDIGNIVNRKEHSQSGAVMAFRILDNMNMDAEDIATVVTAIGNHDEGDGEAVNAIAAALIIADKSDVRRTRVRNSDIINFDIHDRVNYSVIETKLEVDAKESTVKLELIIDTKISSVMNYFEIFLKRMLMCQKAAAKLNLSFKLFINGQQLL